MVGITKQGLGTLGAFEPQMRVMVLAKGAAAAPASPSKEASTSWNSSRANLRVWSMVANAFFGQTECVATKGEHGESGLIAASWRAGQHD